MLHVNQRAVATVIAAGLSHSLSAALASAHGSPHASTRPIPPGSRATAPTARKRPPHQGIMIIIMIIIIMI